MANSSSDYHSTEYRPLYGAATTGDSSRYGPLFTTNIFDKPLFGADTPRDKIINIVVGFVTALLVLITVILSFTLHHWAIWGLNVFFSVCIIFSCAGHLLLVYWYRQGDLDPKFRNLIYLNSFTIAMLCVCAMCYITLAKDSEKSTSAVTTTVTSSNTVSPFTSR